MTRKNKVKVDENKVEMTKELVISLFKQLSEQFKGIKSEHVLLQQAEIFIRDELFVISGALEASDETTVDDAECIIPVIPSDL